MLELWLGLAVAALALLYVRLTSTFSHWRDKGVPFVPAWPLAGSLLPVFTLRESLAEYLQKIYRQHRSQPFVGLFQVTHLELPHFVNQRICVYTQVF